MKNLTKNTHWCSAFELQEPCSTFYTPQNVPTLKSRLDKMTKDVRAELEKQGFEEHRIHVERMLNMRFEGTDTALMVLPAEGDGNGDEDFEAAFKRVYKSEFGFLLETKVIIVDDIKVHCNIEIIVVDPKLTGWLAFFFCTRFAASVKPSTRWDSPSTPKSNN